MRLISAWVKTSLKRSIHESFWCITSRTGREINTVIQVCNGFIKTKRLKYFITDPDQESFHRRRLSVQGKLDPDAYDCADFPVIFNFSDPPALRVKYACYQ